MLLLLGSNAFGVRHYVRGMKERGLVKPDVDKGRLHAGKHPAYPALVDVSDNAQLILPLDMDFLEHTVLNKGDPGLGLGHVDKKNC